jgi:hypothetical protein
MINLYTNVDTGSIAIWPATGSDTGAVFTMEVTHDMDLVSSSFSLSLTNTPDNLSEYYRFNYTGSVIPTSSGQYTYNLQDNQGTGELKWSEAASFFGTIQAKWNSVTGSNVERTIDTGRAFVFGTNDPTFTNYVSSNENGAYVTYNS